MVGKEVLIVTIITYIFLFREDTALSQELVFKNRDKVIKTLSLEQLEKITPSTTITVFEPNESENLKYKGFSVDTF